jgi:NAD(P)-dependent dehydrogenase (short-subunit alcohol dehydrogenase family)
LLDEARILRTAFSDDGAERHRCRSRHRRRIQLTAENVLAVSAVTTQEKWSSSMGTLDGKVVLVTGSGGGLGRASALIFARGGARIAGLDINTEANKETVELVRRQGGEMIGIAPVDLTHPEEVRLAVDSAAAHYGGLDVVYNNAALVRFGPMPEFSVEDWRTTITGELDIPFYVSKFAWPHLVQRGGPGTRSRARRCSSASRSRTRSSSWPPSWPPTTRPTSPARTFRWTAAPRLGSRQPRVSPAPVSVMYQSDSVNPGPVSSPM